MNVKNYVFNESSLFWDWLSLIYMVNLLFRNRTHAKNENLGYRHKYLPCFYLLLANVTELLLNSASDDDDDETLSISLSIEKEANNNHNHHCPVSALSSSGASSLTMPSPNRPMTPMTQGLIIPPPPSNDNGIAIKPQRPSTPSTTIDDKDGNDSEGNISPLIHHAFEWYLDDMLTKIALILFPMFLHWMMIGFRSQLTSFKLALCRLL